jgi:hypothetical protein
LKDDWKTCGKETAPQDHPLFTQITYSEFEKNRTFIFQFLKGLAQGIPQQYWFFVCRLIVAASKEITKAGLDKIENINEAELKGYNLPLDILRNMYKEIMGTDSPV